MHLIYLKDSFLLGCEMFDVAVSVQTWPSNLHSMPSNLQDPPAFRVVYRDVMMASRRHDTTGRDGPLCHDTIGSA